MKFMSSEKRDGALKVKRRFKPIFCAAVLTAAAAFSALAGTTALAEGSKELVSSAKENYKAVNGVEAVTSNMANWNITASTGSFVGVSNQQKFKFYAYEGEYVFLASSEQAATDGFKEVKVTFPDGKVEEYDFTKEAGLIEKRTQEAAGPVGVSFPTGEDGEYKKVETGEGFNALRKKIELTGVYEVEFKADGTNGDKATKFLNAELTSTLPVNSHSDSPTIMAYDITVAKPQYADGVETGEPTAYNAVNGRVWADAWTLQVSSSTYGLYGDLYTVTRDGYVWRVSMNGMGPNTFSFYANSRGNIGTGTNASAYHSVHSPEYNYCNFNFYKNMVDKYGNPDGVYLLGPDNEVTAIDAPNHMFFNYPDAAGLPDSIVLTEPRPIGKVDQIAFNGKTTGNDQTTNNSFAGVGGYFEVTTTNATSYRVVIDMENMFAMHYHGDGEDPCKSSTENSESADEICLSHKDDDVPNFIYYKESDNSWYRIYTDESTRHPANTGSTAEDSGSQEAITKLAKEEKLDETEFRELYEGGFTRGKDNAAENPYLK